MAVHKLPELRRFNSTIGACRWIGQYLLVFFMILVAHFALPRMMPGDPTESLTGTDVDLPYAIDAEMKARLIEYHGLDKSLPRQFLHYLGRLTRFDLGYAIYHKCEVTDLIRKRLPWTLLLAGTGFFLSGALGIALGSAAAYRRGSRLDRLLMGTVLGIRAMPVYLVGMLALLILSVKLGMFPLGGATSPFVRYGSPFGAAFDILQHLALPALILSAEQVAGTFMIMRASMISTLGETYMLTAEAKGLPWGRRVFRYGMRNAILPLYTRLGVQIGLLVTGTLFVETVFNYPGMGRLTYEAVMVHDYPVLQGIFLVTALCILSANILVDAGYRFIDPRVGRAHG